MVLFLIFFIAATGGYDLAFCLFILYGVYCLLEGEGVFLALIWFMIFNMVFEDPNEIKIQQEEQNIETFQDLSDMSEKPNLVNAIIIIQPELEEIVNKVGELK